MRIRLPGTRPFWTGVVCGVAAIWLGRLVINETTIPDRLIAPMLMSNSSANADAIVVLGAGVIGDCVPNLNSTRRVVLGARLLKQGRAPLLVLTGGMAGGGCPVAEAMAVLARDLGIPDEKMLIERQSRSTWQNGERTAPLLRERKISRITLVTDRLHMRRAAGVFARHGFAIEPSAVPIYEGHPDNVSMLSAGLREAMALAYYGLRGRMASEPPENRHMKTWAVDAPNLDGEGAAPEIAHPSGPLVILGASYAASWTLPDLGGRPVVNAGVPGQQSFEMLERFDRDVVRARPRAVVLWGFINDIHRADDMERAVARIRESYLQMISVARAQGIEPILATEVTIRPPKSLLGPLRSAAGWLLRKESYQDRVNRRVIELNQWVREVGQRGGILVLDLHGALSDASGGRRTEFAADDGSHISSEGYEALTGYARPILADHLSASNRGRNR